MTTFALETLSTWEEKSTHLLGRLFGVCVDVCVPCAAFDFGRRDFQACAVMNRPIIDCPRLRQCCALFAVKIATNVIKAGLSGSHSGQASRHCAASTRHYLLNQKCVCFRPRSGSSFMMTHCIWRLHYALACRSVETARVKLGPRRDRREKDDYFPSALFCHWRQKMYKPLAFTLLQLETR